MPNCAQLYFVNQIVFKSLFVLTITKYIFKEQVQIFKCSTVLTCMLRDGLL